MVSENSEQAPQVPEVHESVLEQGKKNRPCENCGKLFSPNRRHVKRQRFCSGTCWQAAYRGRGRARAADSRYILKRRKAMLCLSCKKPLLSNEHVDCPACRRKNLEREKRRYLSRKISRHCVRCGGQKTFEETVLCAECKRTARRYYDKIRKMVLQHYGGKCACPPCKETNSNFFTMDHVNNDGAAHRKSKSDNPTRIYAYLKRNNYPGGFQILCYNCNLGRAQNGGICPHVSSKSPV